MLWPELITKAWVSNVFFPGGYRRGTGAKIQLQLHFLQLDVYKGLVGNCEMAIVKRETAKPLRGGDPPAILAPMICQPAGSRTISGVKSEVNLKCREPFTFAVSRFTIHPCRFTKSYCRFFLSGYRKKALFSGLYNSIVERSVLYNT